jgi:hypothetical protein
VVVRPEGSPVTGDGDGNVGGDRIGADGTGEVVLDNDPLDGSNQAASW